MLIFVAGRSFLTRTPTYIEQNTDKT